MSHPITGTRRSILIYSIVWLVIAALQGFMYWYFKQFPLSVVITDALVSSLFFGFLGLLAWYPTRYIPFQRHTPVYSILAHVVAGLLVLLAWMLLSVGLLNALFSEDADYLSFLNNSLAWRGMLGGLIYLVLVLVYYLASSVQKLQERTRQEERLKNLVRDTELNMLKSQINPHFLFNSLNSISSLTMSSPDEARDMIIRLSDFLRYSLKHRENEYVPLKEELGRMKDYLAIEKIRFGEKLQYEFNIDGACEDFPVPTMIFQPLFENAIRHSVYESTETVTIRFDCTPEKDVMRTVITNDYDPGVPTRKGTGVGLQNVRQRIELAYEGHGTVRWNGEQGKFGVTILFPRIFTKR
ncbi:MAG: histidine kinase [Bacteroidales bacterium]|nr:histidine kinase [Bacteroidales bacterium]